MATAANDPRLGALLAELRWRVWPERFVLVGIDPREQPVVLRLLAGLRGRLWQILAAPDVVTLIIEDGDWRALSAAFPRARVERPYRAITFEHDLPPDLTGFMAVISGALGAAGVPLLALSAFTRDHLLLREGDLARAEAALIELRSAWQR